MRSGTAAGGTRRATRDIRGGTIALVLRLRAVRGTMHAHDLRGEESIRGTDMEMQAVRRVGQGPRLCVEGWTNGSTGKRNGTRSASGTASAGKRTLGGTDPVRAGDETERICYVCTFVVFFTLCITSCFLGLCAVSTSPRLRRAMSCLTFAAVLCSICDTLVCSNRRTIA